MFTLSLGFKARLYGGATPIPAFDPTTLFGTTDTGWVYDLSDMSTLFQDAAGTTPVTAVGQPVGLHLDKSKGLVLGPELVTNGTFDTDTSGWTNAGTGTMVWSSGSLRYTRDSSGIARQILTTVVGHFYKATARIRIISGGGIAILRAQTTGNTTLADSVNVSSSEWTEVTLTFRALTTSTRIDFVVGAPVGAVAEFDNISVKELPGNHRTQSTALNRPTYQVDDNGNYYLSYDGVNDSLATASFAWGTDKATVVAGVRKLVGTSGQIMERSVDTNTNNGSMRMTDNSSASGQYTFLSKGTASGGVVASGYTPPTTNVLTGIGDISGDLSTLRVNGTQVAQSTDDQGTGNFLTYQTFFGARAGTSLFFNGREYSNVGINRLLTTQELNDLEAWTAGRTGITL